MWLRCKPEPGSSQQGYQMWCIDDVEGGFPLEGGRKEVLAGRREIGALQEHMLRGSVPSASAPLCGVFLGMGRPGLRQSGAGTVPWGRLGYML